jgi:hypothetical protein
MKGVVKRGVPKEERWSWDEGSVNVEPPITAYSNAAATFIARYERLPVPVEATKHALQNEIPVIPGLRFTPLITPTTPTRRVSFLFLRKGRGGLEDTPWS